MNRIIKTTCIGIFCFLIPSLSFSQNVFALNDSIKSIYNTEYKTVKFVLQSLINKDFDDVFVKTDKQKQKKKTDLKTYKEIREKLIYSGMPDDTCITVKFNNQIIRDFVYGGDIKLKNVIFEVKIKDSKIKKFNNILFFEFYTDKEKDFDLKTHEYKLNNMYLISAEWYENKDVLIKTILNYEFKPIELDSIK